MNQMRVEFEREYTKNAQPEEAKRALKRKFTGQYILMATSYAWQWWQACQILNDERIAELEQENASLRNRVSNLRAVTHAENLRNCNKHKNNKSGIAGVCWRERDKRWIAQISFNKKYIYLGSFLEKKQAIEVRKKAEVHYGFYANAQHSAE